MSQYLSTSWLTEATPSPTPTATSTSLSPQLREDLDVDEVSPGFAGFVATFIVALALIVIVFFFTRSLRKVAYRKGGTNVVSGEFQVETEVDVQDPQPKS